MSRYRASAWHLLGSVLLLSALFAFIRLCWFPGALFEVAAGRNLILLMLAADLTLGPVVTLFVFNAKKPKIRQDMVVILCCQLAFLGFGLWSTFQARPVYLAFVEDKFYLVTANQIDEADLRKASLPQFSQLPLWGPQLIGTRQPTDPQRKTDVLFAGLMGMGVQQLPEYYLQFSDVKVEALKRAHTAVAIPALPDVDRNRLAAFAAQHPTAIFLKLANPKRRVFLALDIHSAQLLAIL